jgi:hypothetical protein
MRILRKMRLESAMRETIAIILLVFCCVGIPTQPAGAQEDEVRAAMVESLAAWSAADFQKLGTFFDDQARGYMPGGSTLLVGFNPAALEGAVSAGMAFDIEPQEIDIRTVAVAVARVEGVITLPGGVIQEGPWQYSETRVLEDGTWRVVQYHFSSVPSGDGGKPFQL